MRLFIVMLIAFIGLCPMAEGRGCRRALPVVQPKQDLRITWRLEKDGRKMTSTVPLEGTKILWIRLVERNGCFRCDVATDAATYKTSHAFSHPQKIECTVSYGPSIEKRKKTVTGMWCLEAKDITQDMVREFQTEKGGYAIPGDVGRVEVVFQKGEGVKITSQLTSTYTSWFSCGWWPGFVIKVLFKEP